MTDQPTPTPTQALDFLARAEQQFVLWDVVEILQADEDANWQQQVPGHGRYQALMDDYGNSVALEVAGHGRALVATFRWAAGDREERLQLDTRGGATRVARVLQVLAEAPGDDAL